MRKSLIINIIASGVCPMSTQDLYSQIGNEKCARTFFAQTFCTSRQNSWDIPAKFLSSKPKEDKLSREGTNFSTTTPSHGRPPPHRAVSGPKQVNLCAHVSCLIRGTHRPVQFKSEGCDRQLIWGEKTTNNKTHIGDTPDQFKSRYA